MREIGHFVGGKEVNGTSGRWGDVFNPNTGEVQAKVASVPGVVSSRVDLVWDPPWSQDMMGEVARIKLGLDL